MNNNKIHQFIDSDSKSLWIDPRFVNVVESIKALKDQALKIKDEYDNWK